MKDGLMGKAWHGKAVMARQDKVRPLTDYSSYFSLRCDFDWDGIARPSQPPSPCTGEISQDATTKYRGRVVLDGRHSRGRAVWTVGPPSEQHI
jgi:hypothetical protein